jgi:hypothetical protein
MAPLGIIGPVFECHGHHRYSLVFTRTDHRGRLWPTGQMHNTGLAVKCTSGFRRITLGKRMGMAPARRRSFDRPEVFMNHIRKEANHTQTRTEGRTGPLAGRHITSRNHIILCGQMNTERMLGSFVSIIHPSEQEFALFCVNTNS